MATTSRLMPSQSDPSPSINIHDALRSSGSGSSSGSVYASADAGVVVSKTAQEMWKEITSSSDHKKMVGGGGSGGEGSCAYHHHTMTLEDYLAKEGVVREDDGRTVTLDHRHQQNQQQVGMEGGPMMGLVMESVYAQPPPPPPPPLLGYGSGGSGVEGVGGRGVKRRAAPEDPVVDKVAQQKQRRMIKNRESAARSRERKQAYTMELEAMVATLEEERAGLLQEQEERQKKRLEELLGTVVPVMERRRPPLRRTLSI